jgi:hypothetical protein
MKKFNKYGAAHLNAPQVVGQPMTQYEVGRTKEFNGFQARVVKYDDADNVILLDITKKEQRSNETMLGAIELVIPEKSNNHTFVQKMANDISKMFVGVQDTKWFKADKDGAFEKKGDNVLEVYGYLTYKAADESIKAFEKLGLATTI